MDKNKRNRTLLGLAVVAIALVAAVSLAGISFAAGGGPTAAQTPAKAQYGPKKIKICHHTGSLRNPVRTIVISSTAWKAHAKHHDTLGACTAKQIKKAKAAAHKKLVKLALKQLRKHGKHVVVVKNGHGKKK